jgi:hypothetical protein
MPAASGRYSERLAGDQWADLRRLGVKSTRVIAGSLPRRHVQA